MIIIRQLLNKKIIPISLTTYQIRIGRCSTSTPCIHLISPTRHIGQKENNGQNSYDDMSIKSHLVAFLGTKIRKKSEIKTKLRVFFIFTLLRVIKSLKKDKFRHFSRWFAVVPQSAVFYKTSGGSTCTSTMAPFI